MTDEPLMRSSDAMSERWRMIADSFARPYRVTFPMVLLVSLVPLYLFIPDLNQGGTFHVPALPLDDAIPLQPVWAFIYGALYFFLIVLPVLIVRQEEHIRRTVNAYLLIWITAFIFFIVYPTVAPRPREVNGDGFAVWGLLLLYGSDPPYNCFPSLHVAHSFVSALACHRVHRGVGIAALVAASLVAVSTLFTKQHYVADVVSGVALAGIAHVVFLRRNARGEVPEMERRVAPFLAVFTIVIVGFGVSCYWLLYRLHATF